MMLRKVLTAVLMFIALVPVAAQSSEIDLECGQSTVEGAEAGDEFTVTCSAGCSQGSIWGTDVYTDDSDICTAAAHAGVITLEEGGTFTLFYIDGIEDHPASEQNGIESSSWGSWSLSFAFESAVISLEWGDSGQELEGETGTFGLVSCPAAGTEGSIWGTGIYTDDSSVCTAAVHMGLITFKEGGLFNISIVDGQESYEASVQNEIESFDFSEWGRSFVVTPEELEVEWFTTAQELPGPTGTSYAVVCPPDGIASSLWGTEIYTDDSSICTAAVHTGLITLEDGGTFDVTIFDGLDSYESTSANGIDSSEWPAWERSFFVSF
ncbi:MAG: LCCL domain-containing protein [Anaerolineae bacterium]|nr:LCCL domain-containing protein [Anaerolineae bacterium]